MPECHLNSVSKSSVVAHAFLEMATTFGTPYATFFESSDIILSFATSSVQVSFQVTVSPHF